MTGQDVDVGPFHHGVVIAGYREDFEPPGRQVAPTPAPVPGAAGELLARLEQGQSAGVTAGPVALRGLDVRSEHLEEAPELVELQSGGQQALLADVLEEGAQELLLVGAVTVVDRAAQRPVGEAGQVSGEELDQGRGVHRRRTGPVDARCRRVYQSQHCDSVTEQFHLLGHLESHHTSHGPAAEKVRSLRLDVAEALNVVGRHVRDGRPGQCVGDVGHLQAVERPILSQASGKVRIAEDVASHRMNAEEGAPEASRLNLHQRGPAHGVGVGSQEGRQLFDRPVPEEGGQGKITPEGLPDARHQPHGQQGMAAGLEEVFANTDRPDLQEPFPETHQPELYVIPRGSHRFRGPIRSRRGQGAPVQLSLGRSREGFEEYDRRRHHVLWQLPTQESAELFLGRRHPSVADHDVAHQLHVSGAVPRRRGRGLADRGMEAQGELDLRRLDTKAPDLHLGVDTGQELQVSVRQPADKVARAVGARAALGRARRRDESPGCQGRLAEVSSRNVRSSDAELARHTQRRRLESAVEHEGFDASHRPSDRGGLRGPAAETLVDPTAEHSDGRFGGAEVIVHLALRGRRELGDALAPRRLAAEDETARRQHRLGPRSAPHGGQVGRSDFDDVNAVLQEVLLEKPGVERALFGDDVQGAAAGDRREEHGIAEVDAERLQRGEARSRGPRNELSDSQDVAHDLAVLDDDAFGGPGGARSVEDVGGVRR